MHRSSVLLPLVAGLTLAATAPAQAATFTVGTVADASDSNSADGACAAASAGGQCTLRAAIGQAQFTPGADQIVLPAGNFQLLDGLGQLNVTSLVTITGAGARKTTIRAAAGSRVMTAQANLALRDLGITGGSIESNTAIRGGGIAVTAGDATLERVAVYGNTVASATNAWGGGIAADGGSLEIVDSTISGNTVIGRVGNSNGGSATGGGVAIASPTVMRRTTVVGNTTRSFGAGMFSVGGGVSAADETTLDHVTLVGNVSSTVADSSGFRQGGNLYIQGDGQRSIAGSILAGGAASYGADCYIASGKLTEPARNISSSADCLGAGSLRNANVQLGALTDNGGPTDTVRPAAASPAINAATGCGLRPLDQRGGKLPAGGACDLGAVEIGGDRRVALQTSKTQAAGSEDVTLVATVTNDGPDNALGEIATIELPAGAIAATATSTLGSCTIGASAVTCALGTLGDGAVATLIATVRTQAPAGVASAFKVRRAGALPDPTAANDEAQVSIAAPAATASAQAAGGGEPGTAGAAAPTGAAPAGAPALTGLKLGRKATLKRGAELRFTLSAPATVKVVTERLQPGRLKGAACKAGKTGKRCTRAKAIGTQQVVLPAGAQQLTVPRAKLRAGKVRVTLTPVAAAASGKPVSLTATVRKR